MIDPAVLFSVVVPTYNRPAKIRRLIQLLAKQRLLNFELVIVDQTPGAAEVRPGNLPYRLRHIRIAERGPAKARNIGIKAAEGTIVAFTDDDCEPEPRWLENAQKYFKQKSVAGIEGRVVSDRDQPDRFRIVQNRGIEGLAFMTANLLVRRNILEKIGGLDERFAHPFREDTDLGWRLLGEGPVPFAEDVRVLHPAAERTGPENMSLYFSYDALLCEKHPDLFERLAGVEGHYAKPGYWQSFGEGMVRHGVTPSLDRLRKMMSSAEYEFLKELSSWVHGSNTFSTDASS